MSGQEEAQMDWAHGTPMMVGPWMMGLADPSPETIDYWEGVKEGRLLVKRCRSCGAYHHPRRLLCTKCTSDEFDWVESSGLGTVYTYSEVHRAPTAAFQAEAPYTIGLIELDEGVFFCSRVNGTESSPVGIGSRVSLGFAEIGSFGKLPVFTVVDE